jgi:hypothetical protein
VERGVRPRPTLHARTVPPAGPDVLVAEMQHPGGEALQCAGNLDGACWWLTLLMSSVDRSRDDPADAREAHSEPHEAELERREAAVAEREAAVAEREAAVAEREAAVAERETAQAKRMNVAQTTLAAADERDAVSDTRDAAAEKRGNDADLAEMMDPKSEYGAHWPERRYAAGDRRHAKDDRTASRDDRHIMTEGDEEHDAEMT